jgi:hypothetical protein
MDSACILPGSYCNDVWTQLVFSVAVTVMVYGLSLYSPWQVLYWCMDSACILPVCAKLVGRVDVLREASLHTALFGSDHFSDKCIITNRLKF